MASRTQLRLGQITGSFGDVEGGIVDNLPADNGASLSALTLSSGSMVGVMSEIASSLLRLHGGGGNTFLGNAESTLTDIDGNTRITYAVDGKLLLSGSGTGADAVDIDAPRGGVDIDAVEGIVITNAASGDAKDLIIEQTGATNSSVIIRSSGTAADAMSISTSAGGMDITVAGAAAGEDLDITADSSINITSSENVADAIVVNASAGGIDITAAGAAGEDIDISNTAGSVNISAGEGDAAAITIDASAAGGGIDITAGNAANDANSDIDIIASNKLTIDAQGTDDGDGVIITLGGDAAETIFRVNNNSGQEAFTVDGAKNANLAGNMTIQGNLDVNGTTTTIDTNNLTVQDSIIGLGVSGSDNSFTDVGDRAIIFARAANASDALPALNYNGTRFEFGKFLADPSSGSMGDADTFLSVTMNGISLPDSDASHVLTLEANGGNLTGDRTLDFVVEDGNRTLTIEADSTINQDLSSDASPTFTGVTATGDLTLDAAGDIILDADGADVFFKDGGTTFGAVTKSSFALVLSGGINDAIVLDANSGEVHFEEAGTRYATLLKDGGGLEIAANQGGDNSVKIGAAGAGNADLFAGTGGMVRLGVGGDHLLNMTASAGSVQIRAAADGSVDTNDVIFTNEDFSAEIFRVDTSAHTLAMPQQNSAGSSAVGLLSFNGTTDSNEAIYGDGDYLYLRSNGIALRLPDANGTPGQVLKVNAVSGNENQLTFGSATAGVEKTQMTVIAALASGSALNPNSATVSNTAPFTRAALDLSGVSGANLDNLVDVFVNGQLLISGSDANVGAGTADYLISTHSATSQLKFGFDLEVDDTVIINKKG